MLTKVNMKAKVNIWWDHSKGPKKQVNRLTASGVANTRRRQARHRQCYSPIPLGRKDHGGSDTSGRPQALMAKNSDKEKRKVASRP